MTTLWVFGDIFTDWPSGAAPTIHRIQRGAEMVVPRPYASGQPKTCRILACIRRMASFSASPMALRKTADAIARAHAEHHHRGSGTEAVVRKGTGGCFTMCSDRSTPLRLRDQHHDPVPFAVKAGWKKDWSRHPDMMERADCTDEGSVRGGGRAPDPAALLFTGVLRVHNPRHRIPEGTNLPDTPG